MEFIHNGYKYTWAENIRLERRNFPFGNKRVGVGGDIAVRISNLMQYIPKDADIIDFDGITQPSELKGAFSPKSIGVKGKYYIVKEATKEEVLELLDKGILPKIYLSIVKVKQQENKQDAIV